MVDLDLDFDLDRRAVVALAVLLLSVSGTGWAVFLYHPAPDSPSTPTFLPASDATLPAPTDGAYRTVATYSSTSGEGSLGITRSVTYVPGNPPTAVVQWSLRFPDDWQSETTYWVGEREYSRTTVGTWEGFRVARNETGEVVRADPSTMTVYDYDPEDDDRPGPTVEPGQALGTLWSFEYERDGTTTYQGRTVARYVPTTGWSTFESSLGYTGSFYVERVSGAVLVDPETGAILKATVEATVADARTWGGVLLGPSRQISVRYRVFLDVDRPAEPAWVDEVRNATNATNATNETNATARSTARAARQPPVGS